MITYPENPIENQTYNILGKYYVYKNEKWIQISKAELLKIKNSDNIEIYPEIIHLYQILNDKTTINIEDVKKWRIETFREARVSKLEKLDIEYMIADEKNNIELKKQIAEKKQMLRDITTIELPNSVELLLNTWPNILNDVI